MTRWYQHGLKRLFDAAITALGLGVFALPMVWIAWRIQREAGLPVLFRQKRIGYQGKAFTILKFRTMTPEGSICSPLSRGLRATAMDELPQLINILLGEMSFVGPRPLIPEDLEQLDRIPDGKLRFSVRPGLTGPAQLYSTKVPSLPQRLQWDLDYVRRCSFSLDLRILLRSILVTSRGAWEKPGPKVKSLGTEA